MRKGVKGGVKLKKVLTNLKNDLLCYNVKLKIKNVLFKTHFIKFN